MTMIGADTSPLQAAREWRGVSLAVAARTSGLALAQAEALEEGHAEVFGSFDEMVASAVLYSASLGIGRDEAMALLDRTISRHSVEVDLPIAGYENGGSTADFSQAVRNRSAVRLSGDTVGVGLAAAAFDNMPESMIADGGADENYVGSADSDTMSATVTNAAYAGVMIDQDESGIGTGKLPVITDSMIAAGLPGSVNEQVQAALELDPQYRAAWEQANSELETWAATRERWSPLTERVRGIAARAVGDGRADAFADRCEHGLQRSRDVISGFRTWLRRSEHAPLLVAVALGIVLLALLIAIASAVSSANKVQIPAATPAATSGSVSKPLGAAPPDTTNPAKAEPVVAKPIMAPAQVHLQIVNIGHRKGYAAIFAAKLKTQGYPIDSVGNAKSGFGGPVILCNKSLAREQARLSKQTGITTLDTLSAVGGRQYCVIAVA